MDIVIWEEQPLQFLEAFQLWDVRVTHNVVKSHVLETDLLYSLLEISIVKYFKGIAIYEQHCVSFYLSMSRLDQTFIPRLFSSLVAIQTKSLNPFHFVFPFLTYYLQKSLRWYVITVYVIICGWGNRLVWGDICTHIRVIFPIFAFWRWDSFPIVSDGPHSIVLSHFCSNLS